MGKFWITVNGKRKRTAAGVKHEYEKFQSSAKAKAERSARNSARRKAMQEGRVHKGDGKDVDHIRGVAAGNGKSNLRVMSASANRGRRQASRKRGSKRSRRS
jgi:hypothetical protein